MGQVRAPLDPVADLKRRLARACSDPDSAHWRQAFQQHGSAGRPFGVSRGVPLTSLRSCVRTWWADHGLAEHPTAVGKRVAIALIEQVPLEDKLAGIAILHELLGSHLRASDLSACGRLFARGHLADTGIVDWFCLKVLVTLLDRTAGRSEVARAIAQWRLAESMWQRRAACVAFTKLASAGEGALPGLPELITTICATVVWSHEAVDQIGVGWVLRELSRAEPGHVEQFFRKHALLMSKDCARHAVAKFSGELRAELLAHHKRATSLARG